MESESGIRWSIDFDILTEEITGGGKYGTVYHGDNMGPEDFYRRYHNCFTGDPDKFHNGASYYGRALYCVANIQAARRVCSSYGGYIYMLAVNPKEFLYCDYGLYKEAFPESTSTKADFCFDQIWNSGIFSDESKARMAADWLMNKRFSGDNSGGVAMMTASTYPEIYNSFSGIVYGGASDDMCMIVFDYARAKPIKWCRTGDYDDNGVLKMRAFDPSVVRNSAAGVLNRMNTSYNENIDSRDLMFRDAEVRKFANVAQKADENLKNGNPNGALEEAFGLQDIMERKFAKIMTRFRTGDSIRLHQLMSSIISSNNSISNTSKQVHNYDMIVDLTPLLRTVSGNFALVGFFKSVKEYFLNADKNKLNTMVHRVGSTLHINHDGYYNTVATREIGTFVDELDERIKNMMANCIILCLFGAANANNPSVQSGYNKLLGFLDTRGYYDNWRDAFVDMETSSDFEAAFKSKTAIGYNTADKEQLGIESEKLFNADYPSYKKIIDYMYDGSEPVNVGSGFLYSMWESYVREAQPNPIDAADEFYDLAQKVNVLKLHDRKWTADGVDPLQAYNLLKGAENDGPKGRAAFIEEMRKQTDGWGRRFYKNLYEYVR